MRGKFPRSSLSGKDWAVDSAELTGAREGAIERADRHSPFLREAMAAKPAIVAAFLKRGALAAAAEAIEAEGETEDSALRTRREGLALAVALGDLSGELSLEQVTALLSDFADRAIDGLRRRCHRSSRGRRQARE